MSVNQDVEVRAIDITRSNVCGSRTAALAVADTARYPTNANLFPGTKANQKTVQIIRQPMQSVRCFRYSCPAGRESRMQRKVQ